MREPIPGLIIIVRDEIDLIRQNLLFHHRQGFRNIVVMDNASTDGTREALEALKTVLPLRIVDEPDTSFRQVEWATGLAKTLAAAGADWGIRSRCR